MGESYGLLVLMATDRNGKDRSPHNTKISDGPFTCCDCGDEVGFRRKAKTSREGWRPNRAHFYHPEGTGSKHPPHPSESTKHKFAKEELAYIFRQCQFHLHCYECKRLVGSWKCNNKENYFSHLEDTSVKPYKTDVAIFNVEKTSNPPEVVLEIYYTHKIGTFKREDLLDKGVKHVFEIDCNDVLKNLQKYENVFYDHISKYRCNECLMKYRRVCDDCSGVVQFATRVLDRERPFACSTCAVPCSDCCNHTSVKYSKSHDGLCDICWSHRRTCCGCGIKFQNALIPVGKQKFACKACLRSTWAKHKDELTSRRPLNDSVSTKRKLILDSLLIPNKKPRIS